DPCPIDEAEDLHVLVSLDPDGQGHSNAAGEREPDGVIPKFLDRLEQAADALPQAHLPDVENPEGPVLAKPSWVGAWRGQPALPLERNRQHGGLAPGDPQPV